MSRADVRLPQARRFGETSRRDLWWVQPALVFLGLMTFIVYSTWAAFQGDHYWFAGGAPGEQANYLSPMYSPPLFDPKGVHTGHAWFGEQPDWLPWPSFLVFTPALLVLWAPGGFRLTCYYYRGAYYKAFWADPPSCAVGEPRKSYLGENSLPLVLQNVHRYFLYLALAFIVFLTYDAVQGFRFGPEGERHFGIGVGSLVLTLNAVLLGGYTLGCHSLRHIVGGFLDRLAGRPVRAKVYDCVSCLNRAHMRWAWASLLWVGFTDLYVRLCSMGVWTDFRLM